MMAPAMRRTSPAYVSQHLKLAALERRLKEPQYETARQCGQHPSVYSSLINDIIPIREGDPRVLKIAEVLGVPSDQAFATERQR
jgi:hypothetical protein